MDPGTPTRTRTWRSRQDSNLHPRLRRPLSCPLDDESLGQTCARDGSPCATGAEEPPGGIEPLASTQLLGVRLEAGCREQGAAWPGGRTRTRPPFGLPSPGKGARESTPSSANWMFEAAEGVEPIDYPGCSRTPFRLATLPWQGRQESNLLLRFWRPFGRHGLAPSEPPLGIEPSLPAYQAGVPTTWTLAA